jgi:hypothetical protein
MKRYLVLLVVLILAAGVVLFEEQHRAASTQHQIVNLIPPPKTEAPLLLEPAIETPGRFSQYADLWNNPRTKNPAPDPAYFSLAFQKDLTAADLIKIQTKAADSAEPVLTFQDREAALAIFSTTGFKLTFNLKPEYATPEASLPNHLDPGIGGSFSF